MQQLSIRIRLKYQNQVIFFLEADHLLSTTYLCHLTPGSIKSLVVSNQLFVILLIYILLPMFVNYKSNYQTNWKKRLKRCQGQKMKLEDKVETKVIKKDIKWSRKGCLRPWGFYQYVIQDLKIKIKAKDLQSLWITNGIKKSSKCKQRLYNKFLKIEMKKMKLSIKIVRIYFMLLKTILKRLGKLLNIQLAKVSAKIKIFLKRLLLII